MDRERGDRVSPIPVAENNFTCDIEGCGKVCASKAGLTIHRKRKHQILKKKNAFQMSEM